MRESSVVMGRARVGSGRSVLLLLLCGTLLLTGCGLLRRSSDTPDPAAPPTEEAEPTAEPSADSNEAPGEEASDESSESAPPEQTGTSEPVTESESTEEGEAAAESELAEPPTSEPDDAVPPKAPESEEAPEGEGFLVDLPPEERAALQEQVQTDLTTALEILDAWAKVPEVSNETAEKLQTVQDFVELSRAAVDEEDLLGASNLALKARILALEIGRP